MPANEVLAALVTLAGAKSALMFQGLSVVAGYG